MNRNVLVTMREGSFPRQQLETEFVGSEDSPFDALASAYDAWFEGEGKLAPVWGGEGGTMPLQRRGGKKIV